MQRIGIKVLKNLIMLVVGLQICKHIESLEQTIFQMTVFEMEKKYLQLMLVLNINSGYHPIFTVPYLGLHVTH